MVHKYDDFCDWKLVLNYQERIPDATELKSMLITDVRTSFHLDNSSRKCLLIQVTTRLKF